MKYVYIETYGCAANQNNSEILAGLLKQSGYELTNNENIAEIIIINSCIVKGKTENKIKRRIQDIAETGKLTIITGCMPETDAKQLKELNPNVLLLGTHHFKDIVKIIRDNAENKLDWEKQNQYLEFQDEEKLLLPKIPQNKLISIVQISEGCLGKCTYCKTRLAKGNLFSYPKEKIISTIKNDLQNSAKEIWITSQDNGCYGLESGQHRLPELLKEILELKGNFKIRLGMMNPNHLFPILDKMVSLFKHKKMYKFLHIPIQSASDKVLKDMNRFYKIDIVKEMINRFRKEIPDITLATDIIIGYPTETEDDFQKNLDFIDDFRPDVFNLSKFSKHKGTDAENLEELPIDIINERTTKIMDAHKKTALENKKRFINKEVDVFVNKKLEGFYEARDENYNIVLLNKNTNILGKKVKVKIKQIAVHHMFGELLDL